METLSVWWFLLTAILSSSLTALLVAGVLKRAFDSSSVGKRMNSLEIAQGDSQLAMQTLLESHKRLRSRIGMQELRSKAKSVEDPERPGVGASKAELRDFYLRGKTPQQIAAIAAKKESQQ